MWTGKLLHDYYTITTFYYTNLHKIRAFREKAYLFPRESLVEKSHRKTRKMTGKRVCGINKYVKTGRKLHFFAKKFGGMLFLSFLCPR